MLQADACNGADHLGALLYESLMQSVKDSHLFKFEASEFGFAVLGLRAAAVAILRQQADVLERVLEGLCILLSH